MKYMNKHRMAALGLAAVIALSVTACSEKRPSQDEVEQAIAAGTLTVEDALNKGWVDQAWVDAYVEENSVPAASKSEAGAVGDFTTTTLSGEEFTQEQMSPVTFFAFADPADEEAGTFFQVLVDAYEGIKDAGGDIVLCTKSESGSEVFDDAPFPVILYNDSLKEAVSNHCSIIEEIPNTASWYINGSFLSAWSTAVDADELIESAETFVEMKEDLDAENSDNDRDSAGVIGTEQNQDDGSTTGDGGAIRDSQGTISNSGAAMIPMG